MKIKVKLYGHFMHRLRFGEKELEVSAPLTVKDLFVLLRMDDSPKMVTRNGQALEVTDSLKDGDRVVIAPVFSGG